eukprot:TRINITY_DN20835_c0_g1_i1.p1 TRINITY_DN20835_c0_g1~~TRINITY_DN20835_c0_g1_i1.p1  ORF type:complete len:522 (+),score=61.69 TRINITY_DN20835_c0_g1_i1:78-1643(+)
MTTPAESQGAAEGGVRQVCLRAAERLHSFESSLSGHRSLATLYLLVFFSQFKPSEPFLVDYLVEVKGFKNRQVFDDIFPLYVYARLPCVALVGLLAELPHPSGGGGRRILAAGAACGLATEMLTCLSSSLFYQQLAQFSVAGSFASRYVVNPIIFALAPPSMCQQHVHMVKFVLLFSNAGSALLGEVLRDYAGVPLQWLYGISIVSQAASLVCACLLLRPEATDASPREMPVDEDVDEGFWSSMQATWKDLLASFRLRYVMWWTLWALTMNPTHGLALTYWQNLLRAHNIQHNHNGYILGGTYLAAAVLVAVFRRLHGMTEVLVVVSLFAAGIFLTCLAVANEQIWFYCNLLVFQSVFEVMSAVSTFQVGSELKKKAASGSARPWCLGRLRREPSRPQQARLTVLFSATGVLVGVAEIGAQACLAGEKKTFHSRSLFDLGFVLCGYFSRFSDILCHRSSLRIGAQPHKSQGTFITSTRGSFLSNRINFKCKWKSARTSEHHWTRWSLTELCSDGRKFTLTL